MKLIPLAFILLIQFSCTQNNKIFYLDNEYPDLNPQIYAPDIFSKPDRFEHGISMRKNGKEHYSMISNKNWEYLGILRYRYNNEGKLITDTLNFNKVIKPRVSVMMAGEACFSNDEKTMYFVSDFPTDIWKSTIDENNNWLPPIKLDSSITFGRSEWKPFIAADNSLYYGKEIDGEVTIYKANMIDGKYTKGEKLVAPFNRECGDQVLNKKMDIIIFAAPWEEGFGELDLYVAFKDDEGNWSNAHNLGNEINTPSIELAPFISPDEKFLFFTRRDRFNNGTSSDIYWVSMDIVHNLKKQKSK